MAEYQVTLKPVYSCPADEIPDGIQLPEGWGLSWHQVETWKALNDPEIDVIFNTAMTGDGKSLAAYLRTLQEYFPVMGLYPTNELARDQMNQIEGYIRLFQPVDEPRVNRLSGPELELYAERDGKTKAIAIETRTKQSEILLTNPDIFHYLHRGAYLTPYDNPDKLWNSIDKFFNFFLFDEFHVFGTPQIASVINTMLLIRRANRQKRYLFLSATPDEGLLKRLEVAGFRYRLIDPVKEGKYEFPDTVEEMDSLEKRGWRKVTSEIELSFIPLPSTFQASENWLKENKERILDYFKRYPGSKGAIILNSIASVKRLTPEFKKLFHPLTVEENTGLTGQTRKNESLQADLVIGTSTIDVGVDFKINFLIFESSDAGNFIQRLGRLGRHARYEREGEEIKFPNFTAIALTPKYLVDRLFDEKDGTLQVQERYNRIQLQEAIKTNYRRINNFEGYYKRWGAVQSFQLWWNLGDPKIKSQYGESREKFQKECETVFGTSLKRVAGRVMGWAKEWRELSGKNNNPIFEDASSFRGTSPLLCGLYDEREPDEGDRFKTYDLPSILSNLEVEVWREAEFKRKIEATKTPISRRRFDSDLCLAFMKLVRYREVRLDWRFIYAGNLREVAEAAKVQVLTGITIWQPDNPWIQSINRELRDVGLVSYVVPCSIESVRQRGQLPMHFGIYPISDGNSILDSKQTTYSIAIGPSALLLDTLGYRFKGKGGEMWIC